MCFFCLFWACASLKFTCMWWCACICICASACMFIDLTSHIYWSLDVKMKCWRISWACLTFLPLSHSSWKIKVFLLASQVIMKYRYLVKLLKFLETFYMTICCPYLLMIFFFLVFHLAFLTLDYLVFNTFNFYIFYFFPLLSFSLSSLSFTNQFNMFMITVGLGFEKQANCFCFAMGIHHNCFLCYLWHQIHVKYLFRWFGICICNLLCQIKSLHTSL